MFKLPGLHIVYTYCLVVTLAFMLAATVNFRDYLVLEHLLTALLTHLKCFISKMRMPSKFALNFGKGKNCSVLALFRFSPPEMAEEAHNFYAHKVVNTEIKSTTT